MRSGPSRSRIRPTLLAVARHPSGPLVTYQPVDSLDAMAFYLEPNLAHADQLILDALKSRYGEGATFENRSEAPAFKLSELVGDDGGSYSKGTSAEHFGKVARLLMRLVYELNVNYEHVARPSDLNPKDVYVVDVMYPAELDGRTQYLAVTANDGPAVLVAMPNVPRTLLEGTGTVADTRAAMRLLATEIAELTNAALPSARTLAAGTNADG